MRRDIQAAGPARTLRICGGGAVTIEAAAPEGKGLRRFKMLAYTGAAMDLPGFDRPVIVDLKGVQIPSQMRPILRQHDHTRIVGHSEKVAVDGGIVVEGVLSGAGADAQEVAASADNGFPWQASIGADPLHMQALDRGQKETVNGREIEGPAYIARKTALKEISFVPVGADGATAAAVLAGAQIRGAGMSFEEWLVSLGFVDPSALDEVQTANMQQLYNEEVGEGDDPEDPADPSDPAPADPPAVGAGDGDDKKDDDDMSAAATARLRAAQAAETIRCDQVRQLCAGAGGPRITVNRRELPLEAHAIAEGWTRERTELEILRRQRETAGPFLRASSHEQHCSLQALQGAMILRARGRLDAPCYGTPAALAMDLPSWLRAGINAEVRQRAMEAAHHFAEMSMVDLCREAIRLDGRDAPRGRTNLIRAAFSGGSLTSIFTTNVNALLLQTYQEAPDTTQGWVRETDTGDFKTMDRLRVKKGRGLTKHPRGSTADHESRSDLKESYKIARYSKQFVVDEQDIIDDYFQAFAEFPVEMGNEAARLRPDLVYAILFANAALQADSVALFDNSTHKNTDTSAALAIDKIQAGVTAISKQQENGVNLNLAATHLVVPQTLAFAAREYVQSSFILIAGTAGTVTTRGSENTLKGVNLQVVPDARLDNGVTDPDTGTTYSGDTNDWFLAVANSYGIEVCYLRGTGSAPQVRSFVLERGQWGMGWDICHDIGAKALDYKGLYRGQG
jgi:hypothetical protein